MAKPDKITTVQAPIISSKSVSRGGNRRNPSTVVCALPREAHARMRARRGERTGTRLVVLQKAGLD